MKKKNLQIEVIDHPDANARAEKLESGDGSGYVESNPNVYSDAYEPNHRVGTAGEHNQRPSEAEHEGEEQYSDSMDDNMPKRSLQSFGKNSARRSDKAEEAKLKHNAKMAGNGASGISGISDRHLNDFLNKNKSKDNLNKTTKLKGGVHADDGEGESGSRDQYSEGEDGVPDDEKIDDELVSRQQREAEELLEEAKAIREEDQITDEEEEDEIEEDEKLAKDNKYEDELDDAEDEGDDELDQPTVTKDNKFELNYTVGRIEDGAAILISKDHNLIEIPL